jgi:hypothetical protein
MEGTRIGQELEATPSRIASSISAAIAGIS